MTSECRELLPTTRVPADGPYHSNYPKGVRVSEFISSRAIEPFYSILEELATTGADVSVWEMDQDIGGPRGEKGLYGCSADGKSRGPPPVQDRTRYGLEELMVNVKWGSTTPTKVAVHDLTISPLLSTLSRHTSSNGAIHYHTEDETKTVSSVVVEVAKPLFFEVLKAYQTEYPNWVAADMFTFLRNAAYQTAKQYDTEGYLNSVDEIELDDTLIDTITVVDDTPGKIAEKVGDRLVLKQYNRTAVVRTGKEQHNYKVVLQALDLRANKDTILCWIAEAQQPKTA